MQFWFYFTGRQHVRTNRMVARQALKRKKLLTIELEKVIFNFVFLWVRKNCLEFNETNLLLSSWNNLKDRLEYRLFLFVNFNSNFSPWTVSKFHCKKESFIPISVYQKFVYFSKIPKWHFYFIKALNLNNPNIMN